MLVILWRTTRVAGVSALHKGPIERNGYIVYPGLVLCVREIRGINVRRRNIPNAPSGKGRISFPRNWPRFLGKTELGPPLGRHVVPESSYFSILNQTLNAFGAGYCCVAWCY